MAVYIVKNPCCDEKLRKELEKEFGYQRDRSISLAKYEETHFPTDKYMKWVKEQRENNKLLSEILIKQGFITEEDTITEIGNHIKNSISQHLSNPKNFIIPSVGKLDYNIKGILLIKGITNGEKDIVRNLDLTKTNTILCVCNRKAKYFERCTKFYDRITEGLNFKKVIQDEGPQKIYIARNMM